MWWEDAVSRMNESQETWIGIYFTIFHPEGGKESAMSHFNRLVLQSLPLLFATVFVSHEPAAADSQLKSSAATVKDTLNMIDSCPDYTIIVTASRRQQPSEWVSADHKIVDVERETKTSNKNLVELLQDNVPDWISDYGGGAAKTLSLRSAGSERTLVLVNGMRLASMGSDAGSDLGDISPEMVKKIEIIEGGQSALYGMNAIGGVVNIITKESSPDKLNGSASASCSAYQPRTGDPAINTQDYSLSMGQKVGKVDWFVGMGDKISDGAFSYQDASGNWKQRIGNSFNEWNFNPHIGLSLDKFSFGLTGSVASRLIENPGTITYPTYATTTKNTGSLSFDGSWVATHFLTLKLNSSFSRDSLHYLDTNTFSRQDSRHNWNDADVNLLQEFTFGRQLLTSGVEVLRRSVTSTDIAYHLENGTAVFGSGNFEFAKDSFVFSATPGISFEHSSLFDNQINGKIGLSVSLHNSFRPMIFFNAGSAFHNPAFADLYWPKDAYSVGNVNLKPEHSRDVDFGAQTAFRQSNFEYSARISFFFMRLEDMIVWEPGSDYIWSPVNINAALINGESIQATFSNADHYHGSINFTESIARDRKTGDTLIYRPRFTATTSHSATFGKITIGFAGRYTSKVYTDAANTDSLSLPSCFTFDGNCSVALTKDGGVRLVYDMLNMTDRMHSTIEGYPLPGREHRLSLKVGF